MNKNFVGAMGFILLLVAIYLPFGRIRAIPRRYSAAPDGRYCICRLHRVLRTRDEATGAQEVPYRRGSEFRGIGGDCYGNVLCEDGRCVNDVSARIIKGDGSNLVRQDGCCLVSSW